MQKRRFAPSPAMVVALIALFVALGGTSYAALTLPKNSVGTKQLKDGAVTAAKISSSAGGAVKVVGGPGAPVYQGSWHAASGTFGDEGVSFFKDAFGVVHLQGEASTGIIVQRHGGMSAHRIGVTTDSIFTLPIDYRPKHNLWFAAYGGGGSAAYIEITPAGVVQQVYGTETYIGLGNITFLAGH